MNEHGPARAGPDSHPGPELRGETRAGWLWILGAVAMALPWLFYRFTADVHHGTPWVVATLTGVAIMGAAFMLSWAAEVFQMDVSQALALALLSLIAVLPEYAVDVVFAWRAAADPIECRAPEVLAGLVQMECQAPYAVANMTGANRLLIGMGWSGVVLIAWLRTHMRRRRQHIAAPSTDVRIEPEGAAVRTSTGTVLLERGQALELAALAAATVYSFVIPLKGGIGIFDTVVLVSLFAVYAWGTARAPAEEPELVGPAAAVGSLSPAVRRTVTFVMFLFAAAVILVSAEPFAEGLVSSGKQLGIDEFLLVQWLAPLASESPEFLVAMLFAWKGLASAGLRTLVASKVNQWTLLIGTLGAAYSVALGAPADLPLDVRQTEELLLTSAQSLFALALIANFDLSVRESLILLVTFLAQLFIPGTEPRLVFAAFYFVGGIGLLVASPTRRNTLLQLPSMVREAVGLAPAAAGGTTHPAGQHVAGEREPRSAA